MKEHPIIFSPEMVRAIIDGRKTETRRYHRPIGSCVWCRVNTGDTLWVRERFSLRDEDFGFSAPRDVHVYTDTPAPVLDGAITWTPAMYMPKKLTRFRLRVVSNDIMPLHLITAEQADAEGAPIGESAPIMWYAKLWDELHGDGTWSINPLVHRIVFEEIRRTEGVK